MPTYNRKTPLAKRNMFNQPPLFGQNENTWKQNNRWVSSDICTVRRLLESTELTPEELYGRETDLQRPLDRGHCESLAHYYWENPNWIIAPFVFTSPEAPETKEGQMEKLPDQFQILDGQHRVQALHLIRERMKESNVAGEREKLEQLLESHVSLQYISNSGDADARQMFVDLNRTRKISDAELNYLDNRDPIVNAIREALENDPWLHTWTDKTHSNPTGHWIFSINSLKRVVNTIEMGPGKYISKTRREHIATPKGQQRCTEDLNEFIQWLRRTREEFNISTDEDQAIIADAKTRHYAFDPSFVAFMAHIWSISKDTAPDTETMSEFIQYLNLNKRDPANALKADLNLINEKDRMKALKDNAYQEASITLRRTAEQQNANRR